VLSCTTLNKTNLAYHTYSEVGIRSNNFTYSESYCL